MGDNRSKLKVKPLKYNVTMDAPTSTSRLLLGHDYKGRYCPGRSHKGDGIWQPVGLTKLTWGAGGVWAVTISIPKHFRGSQTEKRLTANGTTHVHSKTATTRHWSIFPKDHEITHSNRRDWNVFSKPRLLHKWRQRCFGERHTQVHRLYKSKNVC